MPSLEARLSALEKAAPLTDEGVVIIRLVGMRTDGAEPDPVSRAQVGGQTIVRNAGETKDAFYARVSAARKSPREIALAF
jgi:hypothetical protein